MNTHIYCGCGSVVEDPRAELGLKICKSCAFTGPDVPRPRGRMVYGHKTAGEIEILSATSWNENKKYFVPNGARSCVKNFSRNISA
jgi:hypothetical protein